MSLQSSDLTVARHQIWFHYPFQLDQSPVDEDFIRNWHALSAPQLGDFDRRSYFHRFVADRLFGESKRGVSPAFNTYRRAMPGTRRIGADKLETNGRGCIRLTRFVADIERCELRFLGKKNDENGFRGTAVVSIKVSVNGVARTQFLPNKDAALAATPEPHAFTLTEAMCATDWLRRVYPRYWNDAADVAGDSLHRVVDLETGEPIGGAAHRPDSQGSLEDALFPWITQLLHPIKFVGNDATARIKGEERAYMSSVVALETHGSFTDNDRKEAETIAAISDGDLMRLAEADPKVDGSKPNYYSPCFMKHLKDEIFYDRHAPHPQAENWRSTRYLITAPHICAIGAGEFAKGQLCGDFDKYYRHMHFLCVFELFRLLQFSEDLTDLVVAFKNESGRWSAKRRREYLDRLSDIRQAFLEHTHLHHFSNVSSQLQPKELFERLYAAFGIADLHAEVEQELASATEFAEAIEARMMAERGEQLNRIVSLGVPLGLGLALAALWFPFAWAETSDLPGWYDHIAKDVFGFLLQVFAIGTATNLVWTVLTLEYHRRKIWFSRNIWLTIVLIAGFSLTFFAGGWEPNSGKPLKTRLENAQDPVK
ncbi:MULTISPECIES: hypothetical protein [unclassified Marinovum]